MDNKDVRYESDSLNNSFETSEAPAADEPVAPDDETLRSSDFEEQIEQLQESVF